MATTTMLSYAVGSIAGLRKGMEGCNKKKKIVVMKKVIPALFLGLVVIVCTKNTEVIFMGSDEVYYNYGFPLRVLIVNPDNRIVHVYILNIILNIVLLLPFPGAIMVGAKKNTIETRDHYLFLLSAVALGAAVLLPWQEKTLSYVLCLAVYIAWLVWFILVVVMRCKYRS